MQGRSHLLIALTTGVVFDSFVHLTGDPLTMTKTVTLVLLVKKAIYYIMVGFGSLLPDIDNARSTLGIKLGWISKEIQHLAGHRTIFHSILGLAIGSLLALGMQQLVIYLLAQRGLIAPAIYIQGSFLVFFAVLFGCVMHIATDGLTEGGVPLFWPNHTRFGFPPNRHWRFRTGTWREFVIVYGLIFLVVIGIWQAYIFV